MEDYGDEAPRNTRAHHGGPYTSKHPVPTVQRYREHRAEIKNRQDQTEQLPPEDLSQPQDDRYDNEESGSKPKRAYESLKAIAKDEDHKDSKQNGQNGGPYPTGNRHTVSQSDFRPGDNEKSYDEQSDGGHDGEKKKDERSATEKAAASTDPKEKRKTMKKLSSSKKGRKVTDPVTHLPIVIQDMTSKDLSYIEDEGDSEEDEREGDGWDKGYEGMRRNLFPPPSFDDTKREMMGVYRQAFVAAVGGMGLIGLVMLATITWGQGRGESTRERAGWGWHHEGNETLTVAQWPWIPAIVIVAAAALLVVFAWTVNIWLSRKVAEIFDDETWDAARRDEIEKNESDELPESVAWLNTIFASIWRLINPDLFASLVDTLEDVMQASLPKVVRMVSVDDIGQGSEGVRILGIRWLPSGKADQSVDSDGNITPNNHSEVELNEQAKQDQDNEGMEAEEGDFLNLELGFSYRAMSSGKSIKSKTKNAHLYLKFYLPGGIAIPVWVELKGLIGIMRVRLQLTPDPPFFQLATFTFLGQPHTNISCVPLSKHYSPNLMNIPLISSFVQSAIDASLAEYVAPKSLTLDIKDMLMGDDFKKDTLSRGVIAVHIKSARGFKQGDGALGFMKEGSSDCYVTISWGKFGKPLFATRVLKKEQDPDWDEWAYVLVSPDEINAEETIRVQIWDSDKHTADDDLGRVEVTLKDLMKGQDTRNKMLDREDRLLGEDSDAKMPGTLTWSVGFFSKAHIQKCQLEAQTFDPSTRTKEAMKEKVGEETRAKMRETLDRDRDSDEEEFEQQKLQDLKETEDRMIISAPPPVGFVSGILGVQIHNITGLEVAKLNRHKDTTLDDDGDDEKEREDLPDGYCTITLNHTQIYRTRTKPKNGNPFFNAGTEKFVKDWQTAEVMISVRDAREGENDPLLGVIFLPLRKVFARQTQVMETFPLAGGIGYGKARVSLVWRSVSLDLPKELRGWDWGTLEVKAPVSLGQGLSEDLKGCKLKLKTTIGKAKMHAGEDGWRVKGKKDASVHLAVKQRYASSVVIQFKDSSSSAIVGKEKKYPALAVLWLGNLPDEEEKTVTLKVWKGGKNELKRARSCGSTYQGMEEGEEEPLGEIEMKVRFWRGLSGYHKKFSHKAGHRNVKNVLEILGVVDDEGMDHDEGEISDSDSSSGSDSNDDSDYGDDRENARRRSEEEKRKQLRKAGGESDSPSESDYDSDRGGPQKGSLKFRIKKKASDLMNGEKIGTSDDDGERGVVSQLQDYKHNHKRLHRKHRGVMQWKAARTVDWVVDKAKEGKGKVAGLGRHGEKEVGIETEV